MDEKPLLVQLNWHKDDREGRFLLRRINDKTTTVSNLTMLFLFFFFDKSITLSKVPYFWISRQTNYTTRNNRY